MECAGIVSLTLCGRQALPAPAGLWACLDLANGQRQDRVFRHQTMVENKGYSMAHTVDILLFSFSHELFSFYVLLPFTYLAISTLLSVHYSSRRLKTEPWATSCH